MSNTLLSIVIPCYNHGHFIQRALDSIESQNLQQSFEVIIIDDGSDEELTVSKKYSFSLTICRQENRGLSAARNRGIELSKGKWIKFLDADDELLSDCLTKQLNSVGGSDYLLSVIGYEELDEESGTTFINYPQFGNPQESILLINIAPIHCFLYPKHVLLAINGFDESDLVKGGHEDYDLHLRLLVKNIDVLCVQSIGVRYRKRAGSMSMNVKAMRRTRIDVWSERLSEYLVLAKEKDLVSALIQGWLQLTKLSVSANEKLEECGKKIATFILVNNNHIDGAEANALCKQLKETNYKVSDVLFKCIEPYITDSSISWLPQDIIDRRLLMSERTKKYFDEQWLFNVFDIVSQDADYAIYGAGTLCHQLLNIIGEKNKPLFIVDKNAQSIRFVDDIPVCSPESFDATSIETIVISAVNYKRAIEDIFAKSHPELTVI